MISNIMAALFQICITALILKIYHDTIVKKIITKPIDNTSETSVALEKLEARNIKLQTRESAAQERVWQLEDENRILKIYVQQMKRRVGDTNMIPGTSLNIPSSQIASDATDKQDED